MYAVFFPGSACAQALGRGSCPQGHEPGIRCMTVVAYRQRSAINTKIRCTCLALSTEISLIHHVRTTTTTSLSPRPPPPPSSPPSHPVHRRVCCPVLRQGCRRAVVGVEPALMTVEVAQWQFMGEVVVLFLDEVVDVPVVVHVGWRFRHCRAAVMAAWRCLEFFLLLFRCIFRTPSSWTSSARLAATFLSSTAPVLGAVLP